MRCLLTCAVVLCCLTWSQDSVTYGQTVRKDPSGGVRVLAPFVRVDVGPDGATSVRAPFTAVDVPGHRHVANRPHPMTGVPHSGPVAHGLQPTLADPALADWDTLWRMLDSATIRLDEQLGQIATGSGWREYLQTVRLREMLAQATGPPDPPTADQLRGILARYEQTSEVQKYRSVSSLSGFRMVHSVLTELLAPPLQRDRRRLAESAASLERDLLRLDNGRAWVRHLQLPEEIFVGRSGTQQQVPPPPGTDPSSEPELGHLVDALARFDAISHDPRYRVIAGMSAFQTTHKRLGDYVQLLSATQPADSSLPSQGDVLSLPPLEPR